MLGGLRGRWFSMVIVKHQLVAATWVKESEVARTAGWGWIENEGSFDDASLAFPWSLPWARDVSAPVLPAGVCLRVGSEDLRLESFSLILLMILDMVAVAI